MSGSDADERSIRPSTCDRDPLPGAGIRIILLTELRRSPPSHTRPHCGMAQPTREGPCQGTNSHRSRREPRPKDVIRGRPWTISYLPLVLITTAGRALVAGTSGSPLEAIDRCDHVVGRRPAGIGRDSLAGSVPRRL